MPRICARRATRDALLLSLRSAQAPVRGASVAVASVVARASAAGALNEACGPGGPKRAKGTENSHARAATTVMTSLPTSQRPSFV